METRDQEALGGHDREPSADFKRELIDLLMFHAFANRARQASRDADHSGFLGELVNALVALIEADLAAWATRCRSNEVEASSLRPTMRSTK